MAGLVALLIKILKFVLIAAVVIAFVLLVIFVGAPALIFLTQCALFWIVVAGTIAYNGLTGRPWIINATRVGYERADYAYRVPGWRTSTAETNRIADAIGRGEPPIVLAGEPVELIDH